MRLGYNTNGFAHHCLEDILAILADLGYRSVAITLDHACLPPFAANLASAVEQTRRLLDTLGLRCVVETGARFLLDPRRKHQPTLVSPTVPERETRLAFLCRAVDIARELGADVVSFWSGTATDDVAEDVAFERLVEGCMRLCEYAEERGVRLAFEPEPGMLVDTMDRFQRLLERMRSPAFGLTLDIGHLHCLGETPIADHVRRWRELLWNVHIEDMRRGVHDHLMFGEGEIDFAPVMQAFHEIDYQGGVHVELSRHSHNAVETARRAIEFLRSFET